VAARILGDGQANDDEFTPFGPERFAGQTSALAS
jgi:hypothetical protein